MELEIAMGMFSDFQSQVNVVVLVLEIQKRKIVSIHTNVVSNLPP